MIGLEILETTQEISLEIPLFLFSIIFVISVLIGAISGASCDNCDDFGEKLYSWGGKGYLAGIIAIVLYIALFSFIPDSLKYETYYKATISDEVSYNEFTEKYEIISEKDGIYKIKNIKEDKGLFEWME